LLSNPTPIERLRLFCFDQAAQLANALNDRFPEDTIVQFNYLPTISAQIALNDGDPAGAIELLRAATH